MVDQLVEVFRLLDIAVPVQVMDVPRISQDRIPQRTALLDPLVVEQLVEVPTVVSCSFLQQQLAEQNVDIPVPGARLRGDLQGFLTGQGSTASRVSVAKGAEHSEAVSVAAKAGKFKIASQKTGVSSRGARVARP